jgi:hypothetical protein
MQSETGHRLKTLPFSTTQQTEIRKQSMHLSFQPLWYRMLNVMSNYLTELN